MQTHIDDAGNKFYERNPYYFKVDTAGQQLPYLDRNVLLLVESQEVVALKTISGEASVSSFALTLQDWPLYKENEERGDYRAHLWDSARMEMVFHFNHTAQDPVLREIFNDVRFKQAVSLAIGPGRHQQGGVPRRGGSGLGHTATIFEPVRRRLDGEPYG